MSHGKLYVVDPATRRLTGELELAPGADGFGGAEDGLLLHGDRALVLRRDGWAGMAKPAVPEGGRAPSRQAPRCRTASSAPS